MEWNDETIARLRVLWDEGLSTAEIGRRLNVSKNAIVGKAHRLNLPARPSPIRRDGASPSPRPVQPRRVVGPTLPPLSAASVPPVAVGHAPVRLAPSIPIAPAALQGPPEAAAAEPMEAARPAPVRTAPRIGRLSACCWPIGEPGTKSFHFCDADAVQGKPYCGEHAQLAYVKVRDRREDAA
jgi:GcrA cell cycle regulator